MDIIDFLDFIDEEDFYYVDSFRDNLIPRVRINPFERYDDANFRKKYRFSKDFANKIVDLVKEDLPSDRRGGAIHPQIQVACALRCWARHQIFLQIQDDSGDMHGISQQAVSKICRNVAEALAKKAHLFISMPSFLEEQQGTIRGFRSICGFPTVIGAIDCTHIRRTQRKASKKK
ncbi:putative nuclease HARBI1 [Spodoptera litura]|uniref:Nuclease HARBI1 n=1 Tax=Spodoptera litura TaxID=69820 RepID=A0A9J7E841_SPOLT|nr:putative nuclease HARBI1 [Spodoptera litura]